MEIKYLTIRDWMLQLGLSYTELVAFALVWAFTKDGEDWFRNPASAVAKWMCVSTKRPVLKAFASLVDKGLIEKRDRWENGVHLCDYRTAGGDVLKALGVVFKEYQGGVPKTPGVVSERHRGGAPRAPHNKINNIDNGYKYPHQKEDAHTRVSTVHGDRFLEVWNRLIMEPGWSTKSQSALDEYMKDLNAVSEDDAIEMVRNSIKNGWKGIFPLSRRSGTSETDEAIAAADRMEKEITDRMAARAAANEIKS